MTVNSLNSDTMAMQVAAKVAEFEAREKQLTETLADVRREKKRFIDSVMRIAQPEGADDE